MIDASYLLLDGGGLVCDHRWRNSRIESSCQPGEKHEKGYQSCIHDCVSRPKRYASCYRRKGHTSPSYRPKSCRSRRTGLGTGLMPVHLCFLCFPSTFSSLLSRAFGSLQRVELHHFLGSSLDVGREIAGAVFPLDFRLGAGLAVDALL